MPLSLRDIEDIKENLLPSIRDECRNVIRQEMSSATFEFGKQNEQIEKLFTDAREDRERVRKVEKLARGLRLRKQRSALYAAITGLLVAVSMWITQHVGGGK